MGVQSYFGGRSVKGEGLCSLACEKCNERKGEWGLAGQSPEKGAHGKGS